MAFKFDLCVVGGCGHVGLPLAAAFADQGLKVVIYDINQAAIKKIQKSKTPPFIEKGLTSVLKRTVGTSLFLSEKSNVIAQAENVVVIIGTPVDEYLNPMFNDIRNFFISQMSNFRDGQLVILRSTVFPGTSANIQQLFSQRHKKVAVAFCPERIAEGNALDEFRQLPQIISAFKPEIARRVKKLFLRIADEIVDLAPLEAELAKLFTNSFRYIQFAIANQFYQVAHSAGVNYDKIYRAITYKYPRARGFTRAGFAAGPCLFKDTMQLAAFSRNTFFLGHAAMLINEGLPGYLVSSLKQQYDLSTKKVGILGMAFKAESDDPRDSLSFKLRKLLTLEAAAVYCHDPFVVNPKFVQSAQKLINLCDIIIIGAPHAQYKSLKFGKKTVLDIWNHVNLQEG